MSSVKNFCLFYTKHSLDEISSQSLNKKLYVIGLPDIEEVLMCSTKSVPSYRELARINFGKRTLSDIDSYTLENFYNEQDFFECLGLISDLSLDFDKRKNMEYKKLFIAYVKENGWVERLTPIFDNDMLLEKIQSFASTDDDFIYDYIFIQQFYSMIADNDKSFYDFLQKKIKDEKSDLLYLASKIRYFERKDIEYNKVLLNPNIASSSQIKGSAARILSSYPTYRQAFVMMHNFLSSDASGIEHNTVDLDKVDDPYEEITGISKSKK